MKQISLFVFLIILFIGCSKKPDPQPIVKEPTEEEPVKEVNPWKGKTIVWTGTSIPWQYAEKSYPNQIARYLEAEIHNTAISGSTIIFFPRDSTKKSQGSPGMSATWDQLRAVGFQHPYSYMSRIFEYKPDLIVIDHGQNDVSWIVERLGDITSTDIGTAYGAFNTTINACKKKFPKATIMLCTPPVEYIYKGRIPDKVMRQQLLAKVIRDVAKAQNVYLWDLMERSGLTPDMQDKWTTDYMHPNQMKVDSMAKDGAKFLIEKVIPGK
jgi:hypothetical protein